VHDVQVEYELHDEQPVVQLVLVLVLVLKKQEDPLNV
jgi:hypothetical protein